MIIVIEKTSSLFKAHSRQLYIHLDILIFIQVLFVAAIGKPELSDIALDNIYVDNGNCSKTYTNFISVKQSMRCLLTDISKIIMVHSIFINLLCFCPLQNVKMNIKIVVSGP